MCGYVEGYFIKPHIMKPLTLLHLKLFFLELKPNQVTSPTFKAL